MVSLGPTTTDPLTLGHRRTGHKTTKKSILMWGGSLRCIQYEKLLTEKWVLKKKKQDFSQTYLLQPLWTEKKKEESTFKGPISKKKTTYINSGLRFEPRDLSCQHRTSSNHSTRLPLGPEGSLSPLVRSEHLVSMVLYVFVQIRNAWGFRYFFAWVSPHRFYRVAFDGDDDYLVSSSRSEHFLKCFLKFHIGLFYATNLQFATTDFLQTAFLHPKFPMTCY